MHFRDGIAYPFLQGYLPPHPLPSDVADDEWAFLAPSLTLMREDAPQRLHPLRELVNGVRFIAHRPPTARDAA